MRNPKPGCMWEAGCDYLASARSILSKHYSSDPTFSDLIAFYLDTVLHMSSLTTCQALIILAYREFGLGLYLISFICLGLMPSLRQGSFEQASLFIGTYLKFVESAVAHSSPGIAIRMVQAFLFSIENPLSEPLIGAGSRATSYR